MASDDVGTKACCPNPALQPLAFLVGEWRTTGTHPDVPHQSLPGRTSFAWHQGGAFLIMRSQTDHADFPDGVAIFASDGASGQFLMCWFDERGISRICPVEVGTNLVRWHHDDPAFRQRLTITADADGQRMASKGEMAKAGDPWTADLSQQFVRTF